MTIRDVWPQTPLAVSEYEYCGVEIPRVGRNDIPALLNRLFQHYTLDGKHINGVEIGVERGVYSRVLLEGCGNLRLTMVDPWEQYKGYRDHVSQAKMEELRENAQIVQREFEPRCSIIRRYSVQAATLFTDNSLDFVYIDGNHNIQNVIADLAAWTPKVRPGGIISGHDYRKPKNNIGHHVVEAVNAWTYANRISPWFLLGRKDEVNRDANRSWLWVKA